MCAFKGEVYLQVEGREKSWVVLAPWRMHQHAGDTGEGVAALGQGKAGGGEHRHSHWPSLATPDGTTGVVGQGLMIDKSIACLHE